MLSGGAGQSSLRTSGDRRAEVVRQNLERAVAPHRRRLSAEAKAKATVPFEMPPGHRLQIDFGVSTVPIVGEPMRAHLFHGSEHIFIPIVYQRFSHESHVGRPTKRHRPDPRSSAAVCDPLTPGSRSGPPVRTAESDPTQNRPPPPPDPSFHSVKRVMRVNAIPVVFIHRAPAVRAVALSSAGAGSRAATAPGFRRACALHAAQAAIR